MQLIKRSRGILAATVLGVALAALALMPGNFGTALAQTAGPPPPPPPATVTVTVVVNNEATTVVTTPGGLASISLPPGSQITSISLDVNTSPTANSAAADAALSAVIDFIVASGLTGSASGTEVGYIFEIDFNPGTARTIGAGGPALVMDYRSLLLIGREAFQTAGPTVLAKPASATLNVKAETLAQVGGDLSRLQVVFVDPAKKISEPVKMLPSPGPGKLSFEFTKEGAYAVLVRPIVTAAPAAGGTTPATGGAPAAAAVTPRPANTGTGLFAADAPTRSMLPLAAAILGIGALAGAGVGLARRQR